MKGSKTGLRRARKLFRRRRYAQVINYLEPQVFLHRQNPEYYLLLGVSCFRTGDYAGSFSYIQRSLDLQRDHVPAMLTLGAVYLRRRQVEDALRTYLEILELQPNNRRAKRALQWIRRLENPEEAVNWFESRAIRRITPREALTLPRWAVWLAVLTLLGAAGSYVFFVLQPSVFDPPDVRTGAEVIAIDDIDQTLGSTGEVTYVLTREEIQSIFEKIRELYNDHHDNLVRREINRILRSNASGTVKQRAELLIDYLQQPDFVDFQDGFSFTQVREDPLLYEGVYVRWKGRAANVTSTTDSVSFDFLVGYQDGEILEGIVKARAEFAVLINNDSPVEVIGQIVPNGPQQFSIDVSGIRRLPVE